MQFKTQRVEDTMVVMLEGKLMNEKETSVIKSNITEELLKGQKKFILDLKGIEFVNSACLNFLVSTKNIISEKSGKLVLCNVNDQLKRLLDVTKLEAFFLISIKTSDALEILKLQS